MNLHPTLITFILGCIVGGLVASLLCSCTSSVAPSRWHDDYHFRPRSTETAEFMKSPEFQLLP